MMTRCCDQRMMSRRFTSLFEDIEEGNFLSAEDWHEQVQINLGPNVGDITTEYKPPRRGRFTLNYIEARKYPEDGALLTKLIGPEPKGILGPIVVNRYDCITCIVS